MASIDFHLGDLSQINPTTRPFPLLLNNYLQPDSTASLDHTTQQILNQFSQQGKRGADSIWAFANEVVDFAKYVPADHPAHTKLLDLLVSIYTSPRFTELPHKYKDEQLWMELREHLDSKIPSPLPQPPRIDLVKVVMTELDDSPPGEGGPAPADQHYRNYNAFAADVYRLLAGDLEQVQDWALWEFEISHEGGNERFDCEIRDGYAMAAAEWILIDGDTIFRFFREGHPSVMRYPGPLWKARQETLVKEGVEKSEMPMRRWRFWLERFQALAKGERDDEFQFADETKALCKKAVEKMESLETGPE